MAGDHWRNQEREQNGEFGPSLDVAQVPSATRSGGFDGGAINTPANVRDLSTLIETEAGGTSLEAKAAVGAVVLNRMRRNATSSVKDVWDGFAHFKPVRQQTPEGQQTGAVAQDLLSHPERDPANGATHFYTPQSMPKEGQHPGGRGDSLESVPGVVDGNKVPTRNFRPHFADVFPEVNVPKVPPAKHKFYKDPGYGPTR